jgi:hypothetical protein
MRRYQLISLALHLMLIASVMACTVGTYASLTHPSLSASWTYRSTYVAASKQKPDDEHDATPVQPDEGAVVPSPSGLQVQILAGGTVSEACVADPECAHDGDPGHRDHGVGCAGDIVASFQRCDSICPGAQGIDCP